MDDEFVQAVSDMIAAAAEDAAANEWANNYAENVADLLAMHIDLHDIVQMSIAKEKLRIRQLFLCHTIPCPN
jgi:uncharacterized protein with PhoU and TrkA domain